MSIFISPFGGGSSDSVGSSFIGCSVYVGSTTIDVDYNTDVKVPYDTENYDDGDNFNTTDKKFVVPESGKYFISAKIRWSNYNSSAGALKLKLRINGSQVDEVTLQNTTNATSKFNTLSLVGDYSLALDDYIEFYMEQEVTAASGEVQIYGSTPNAQWSSLSIHKIS